jgi:DHA2 family multidrug resistance protein
MEYVLDKGQEDDWFHSRNITLFAVVAAVALVAFVVWEWRQEHPVVEVRLFKNRNFAAANVMMLVLGMALFGSTVLLPQYVQVWMGWSAQQAGEALSPGGVVVIMLLPLVGRLVSRVDARYLIAFGFGVLSIALFHMAHTLYPGIDFSTAVWLRIYQAIGLAFLFVPINTIVYAGVPASKNNAVSGIVNLSRNMGGDIGIAFVTTLIARRAQFHQASLSAHLDPGNPALQARLAALTRALERAGSSTVEAARRATGAIYGEVVRQAQTLAYLDVLWVLAWFAAAMVPLVFLTRRVEPGKPAMGH